MAEKIFKILAKKIVEKVKKEEDYPACSICEKLIKEKTAGIKPSICRKCHIDNIIKTNGLFKGSYLATVE